MRDLERVEVMTPGGVCYEILIPNSVFERLPKLGEEVEREERMGRPRRYYQITALGKKAMEYSRDTRNEMGPQTI